MRGETKRCKEKREKSRGNRGCWGLGVTKKKKKKKKKKTTEKMKECMFNLSKEPKEESQKQQ